MKDIKISILVPIYNVEKYLRECLNSLVKQTLREIEIICINDGSTDSSIDIIKEFCNFDDRVKLINKENSGYGDSMNRGLEMAKGEYIGILESDDYAELNFFEELYKKAVESRADVVKGNYTLFWTNKCRRDVSWNELGIEYNLLNKKINPMEHKDVFLIPPSIWSGIYRRKFLEDNRINFLPTPGASYQDTGFSFKVYSNVNSLILLDVPGINYRQDNENSSMNTNSRQKIYAVDKEYKEIIKYLDGFNKLNALQDVLNRYMLGTMMWNLNRMPNEMVREYIETQKDIFGNFFGNTNNIYKYSELPLKYKVIYKLMNSNNVKGICFLKTIKNIFKRK